MDFEWGGSCVGSCKHKKDQRNVEITPIEDFIHELYQGRAYYLNLNGNTNAIPIIFGLHFSLPDNRKYHNKKFRRGWFRNKKTYYIRNANISFPISHNANPPTKDFNLLCSSTDVRGNRCLIARFYDKNIEKNYLPPLIANFIELDENYKNKKLLNRIMEGFEVKYFKYLILKAIIQLMKKSDPRIKTYYRNTRLKIEYRNIRIKRKYRNTRIKPKYIVKLWNSKRKRLRIFFSGLRRILNIKKNIIEDVKNMNEINKENEKNQKETQYLDFDVEYDREEDFIENKNIKNKDEIQDEIKNVDEDFEDEIMYSCEIRKIVRNA